MVHNLDVATVVYALAEPHRPADPAGRSGPGRHGARQTDGPLRRLVRSARPGIGRLRPPRGRGAGGDPGGGRGDRAGVPDGPAECRAARRVGGPVGAQVRALRGNRGGRGGRGGPPGEDGAHWCLIGDGRTHGDDHGDSAQEHGLGARRRFPDGLRGLLPGGAARPHGSRRRLLDGRAPGHRGGVPALREGDRACHRGRDRAGGRRLPGCHCRPAGARLPGLHAARAAGQPRRLPGLVGLGPRRSVAPSRGARKHAERPRAAPGHPRRVRRRAGLRLVGRQGASDRGRVGVRGARRARGCGLRLGG